ncbi:leucine-rich repeat extensin-like protein 3 [Jatropha curcas]|uniref:leucine-rich repeat extensin-like protein 3 n=1 Tax=Jatropha curcas TaxID=180498 RepID=UPI001894980F|nr:leucine-rich repeat extensin-like protein 3 [Jatropha curcas]
MFAAMAPTIFLLLATFFASLFSVLAQSENPISSISVVGVVYCDTCSTNSFSRNSYFLPGVDVHIRCTFKATSPKTAEQINFSVNRTTDKYGIYKLEIPHVDGVDCVDGSSIETLCQASLIESSSSACNVPGLKTTTNEVSVKSKQDNHCIYSLNALSYRPVKKNITLCGNYKEELSNSFNSSKFFLPFFPPYGFPWPPLAPFPFPPAFNLGDPRTWIPRIPPFPPTPSVSEPPPPPAFNLGDPRTWIPRIPPFPPTPSVSEPPPPPAFNLGDPRTWIPHIPPSTAAPPPPPAFNLRDPRTWVPYFPPSPSNRPQNQNP